MIAYNGDWKKSSTTGVDLVTGKDCTVVTVYCNDNKYSSTHSAAQTLEALKALEAVAKYEKECEECDDAERYWPPLWYRKHLQHFVRLVHAKARAPP